MRTMPHKTVLAAFGVLILATTWIAAQDEQRIGQFDSQSDVGKTEHPGSATFDPVSNTYRVSGSGANIWNKEDDFHYVWRRWSGGLTFGSVIRFDGAGGNAHRKACLMVRQSLDPDAAYADVAVHGDGLISLQFRKNAGDTTQEVQCPLKGPAVVRLTRKGKIFSLAVSLNGEPFRDVGSATVELRDPVYAGLAVSAHDAKQSETAVFSRVELTPAK